MKLINIKKIADGRKILNDVSIEFDNRGMVFIIAIIVTIISAVVMHYFMKISIVQRQYEISILRGMGARKRDIFKMMIFEHGWY